MPDPNQGQQDKKAQEVLSSILQGNVSDVQSINPWIVKSNKLNNKIMRAFVSIMKEQQGWDDAKTLEVVMYLDEAAELGYITNQLLTDLKENPEKITEIKEYIDNYHAENNGS